MEGDKKEELKWLFTTGITRTEMSGGKSRGFKT
jgi:hypothetical protein